MATLSINTSAEVNYSSKLTKEKITELKGLLEEASGEYYEGDKEKSYEIIGNIVDQLDESMFNNYSDQMEVLALKTTIDAKRRGKRVSKAYELINILEKILDRVKPMNGGRRKKTRKSKKTRKTIKRKL